MAETLFHISKSLTLSINRDYHVIAEHAWDTLLLLTSFIVSTWPLTYSDNQSLIWLPNMASNSDT